MMTPGEGVMAFLALYGGAWLIIFGIIFTLVGLPNLIALGGVWLCLLGAGSMYLGRYIMDHGSAS